MGCVVGVRGNEQLEQQFPFVDVFMEPSTDGAPLISHLQQEDEYLHRARGNGRAPRVFRMAQSFYRRNRSAS